MKTTSNPFMERPHTDLGWWAVWLAAVFVIMFLINSFVFMPASSNEPWRQVILPFYGIAMLLCGLAAMVLSLIALIRRHERSWLVFIPLLPGLWVIFMLVGELLFSH